MKKLFINGAWTDARSQETFHSYNPATDEALEEFQTADPEDIEAAMQAACRVRRQWEELGVVKRAEMLRTYLHRLQQQKENLARIVSREVGKTVREAIGEIDDAINLVDYLVGEGKRYFGNVTPSTIINRMCFTQRRAYGVATLLTPWNFPVSIVVWKLAPALLCGNSVVLKPASASPLTACELIEYGADIFPDGTVNLLFGLGQTIGRHLIRHPSVGVISFTGSTEIGKDIKQMSGLKEVGLELGGKNPAVIMPSANIEKAVEDTIAGAMGVAGQRCTATSRVIVHESVLQEVTDRLVARAGEISVGNGLEPETDMGPLISRHHREQVDAYVKEAQQQGARLLCGGEMIEGPGSFYQPTIFDQVTPDMRIAREEVFGPVLCILSCSTFDEAIDIANDVPYGLSSAIYTRELREAFEAANRLEAGITVVNNPPGSVETHLPFGGVKDSGIGREGGIEGIDEFSWIQTVYIDY